MSRLDLIRPNQQQHTLRKFPQRSQSLRVKSNVVNRFGEPSLASSRSHLKLIITHKDLVVQDSLSQSLTSPFSKHDYSSRSGLVRNQSLQPLDSTLKRYQSLRRSSSQLNDNNSSKPATLVINCSFSPNLILSQQSQLQVILYSVSSTYALCSPVTSVATSQKAMFGIAVAPGDSP